MLPARALTTDDSPAAPAAAANERLRHSVHRVLDPEWWSGQLDCADSLLATHPATKYSTGLCESVADLLRRETTALRTSRTRLRSRRDRVLREVTRDSFDVGRVFVDSIEGDGKGWVPLQVDVPGDGGSGRKVRFCASSLADYALACAMGSEVSSAATDLPSLSGHCLRHSYYYVCPWHPSALAVDVDAPAITHSEALEAVRQFRAALRTALTEQWPEEPERAELVADWTGVYESRVPGPTADAETARRKRSFHIHFHVHAPVFVGFADCAAFLVQRVLPHVHACFRPLFDVGVYTEYRAFRALGQSKVPAEGATATPLQLRPVECVSGAAVNYLYRLVEEAEVAGLDSRASQLRAFLVATAHPAVTPPASAYVVSSTWTHTPSEARSTAARWVREAQAECWRAAAREIVLTCDEVDWPDAPNKHAEYWRRYVSGKVCSKTKVDVRAALGRVDGAIERIERSLAEHLERVYAGTSVPVEIRDSGTAATVKRRREAQRDVPAPKRPRPPATLGVDRWVVCFQVDAEGVVCPSRARDILSTSGVWTVQLYCDPRRSRQVGVACLRRMTPSESRAYRALGSQAKRALVPRLGSGYGGQGDAAPFPPWAPEVASGTNGRACVETTS